MSETERGPLAIDGVYSSVYTMNIGGEQVTVEDVISLVTTDSGDTILGRGEQGQNGLRMWLVLGSTSVAGTWTECDSADEPAFGGRVEFAPEQDGLVGYWSIPDPNGTTPLSNGTWVMSRIDTAAS